MLNDIIDIFIGMFNHALIDVCGINVAEFEQYNYFVSVICVAVSVMVVAGSFSLLIVVTASIFNALRGVMK